VSAAPAVALAALLWAAGALAFAAWVAPRAVAGVAEAGGLTGGLRRHAAWACAAALAALAPLLWMRTAAMTGAPATAAAALSVLRESWFGAVLAAQAAALALALAAVLGGWTRLAAVAAGTALALQAGQGHAMAASPPSPALLAAQTLHLMAAGAWLGALPPLAWLVWRAPGTAGRAACRWFSPAGKVWLAAVAGSALLQGAWLVGRVGALTGTPYGRLVLVKLGLFAALSGFACANRYVLAPRLPRARGVLLASLAGQIAVGVLTVWVAAVLAGVPPPGPG
jgi:putative copper export protein